MPHYRRLPKTQFTIIAKTNAVDCHFLIISAPIERLDGIVAIPSKVKLFNEKFIIETILHPLLAPHEITRVPTIGSVGALYWLDEPK